MIQAPNVGTPQEGACDAQPVNLGDRAATLENGLTALLIAKPKTSLVVALSLGMVIGWIVKRKR